MFYDGWIDDLFNSRDRIIALADLLADDFSRQVLDANLGYRMTCDPMEQDPVIEWELYGPKNLLVYGDDEVYVDGGAYDGDSIRLFIDRVGGKFDKVYGFEPDSNTYERLAENFRDEPRVEPVKKGLFSEEKSALFRRCGHPRIDLHRHRHGRGSGHQPGCPGRWRAGSPSSR